MSLRKYQKLISVTIILLYALFLAGGLVRATGAGLGCPDWPKCFGQWIPPTSISELPADYKERFQIAGKVIADFDAIKTWTEYLNRLLGAVIGLFFLALFIGALRLRPKRGDLLFPSGALVILVALQGGIGARVVSSHLLPYMITIHMLLALIILLLLIKLRWTAFFGKLRRDAIKFGAIEKGILLFAGLSIIQLVLGTQVRQAMDEILHANGDYRFPGIVERAGWIFYLHRSFSIVLLLNFLWIVKKVRGQEFPSPIFKSVSISLFSLIASGVIMAYGDLPRWAQPVHLVFVMVLLGSTWELLLERLYSSQGDRLLSGGGRGLTE